jgi:WD40 repeat protein
MRNGEGHSRRPDSRRPGPPLKFQIVIKNDPEKALKGTYQAHAGPAGLVLDKGKEQVVIPIGTRVRSLKGNLLTIEFEGRRVEVQVGRLGWYVNRLARDIADFLEGKLPHLNPRGYALEWYLFAAAVLPAGIPLITLGGAIPAAVGFGLVGAGLAIAQMEKAAKALRLTSILGISALAYTTLIVYLALVVWKEDPAGQNAPLAPHVDNGRPKDPGKDKDEVVEKGKEIPPASAFPGLLAYWPFDDGAGQQAVEKSGSRGSATLEGRTRWVKGMRGTAAYLTSDGHVSLGLPLNFPHKKPFTLTAWIKADQPFDMAGAPLFEFRKANEAARAFLVYVDRDRLAVTWGNTPHDKFEGVTLMGPQVPEGKWLHFAVTRKADNSMQMYVNGERSGDAKFAHGDLVTNRAVFGREGGQSFQGAVDEVAVFKRALWPEEIACLAGIAGMPDLRDFPPEIDEPEKKSEEVPLLDKLGLKIPVPGVADLAFSADGKSLICAEPKALSVWTLQGGQAAKRHAMKSRALAVGTLSNGKIAFLEEVPFEVPSPPVKMLDPLTMQVEAWSDFKLDRQMLGTGQFSGDGKLAFTHNFRSVFCLDVLKKTPISWVYLGGAPALSPDGKTLITAHNFSGRVNMGILEIWNTAEGEKAKAKKFADWSGGHFPPKVVLRFAPDGKSLFCVGVDKRLYLFEVPSGKVHKMLTVEGEVYGGAFHPREKLLSTITSDGRVHFWDTVSGKPRAEIPLAPNDKDHAFTKVEFSPDGNWLAAATAKNVFVLDMAKITLAKIEAEPPPKVEKDPEVEKKVDEKKPDEKKNDDKKIDPKKIDEKKTDDKKVKKAVVFPEPKKTREPLALTALQRLEVVKKPKGDIFGVEMAPDGRFLMASLGGRTALWQLPDGKEILALDETAMPGAVFSADALYWRVKDTIERVDLPKLKRHVIVPDLETGIEPPHLSSDGKYVLVRGSKQIVIRSVDGTAKEARPHNLKSDLPSLVYDPEDTRVFAGEVDKVAMVGAINGRGGVIGMKMSTGRPFRPRLALRDDILAAALPQQGAVVLLAKNTRVAAQLETHDPQPGDDDEAPRPVLSKDGQRLFLVGKKQLTIWHLKTGHVFETVFPVKGVKAGTISQDGTTLALLLDTRQVALFRVGAQDKSIEDKKLNADEQGRVILTAKDVLQGLAFSPDRKTLITVDRTKAILLWDLAKSEIREAVDFKNPVPAVPPAVAISRDGKHVAAGTVDGKMEIFDMDKRTWRTLLDDVAPKSAVSRLAFFRDGQFLIRLRRQQIDMWDLKNDRHELLPKVFPGGGLNMGLALDHKSLALATSQGVFLLDLADKKSRAIPVYGKLPAGEVAVSGPVPHVIACLGGGTLHVMTGSGAERLWTKDAKLERVLAFTPDGKTLAAAGFSDAISLFDTATGKVHVKLPLPGKQEVRRLHFSADGRLLAALQENHAIVWDLAKTGSVQAKEANKIHEVGNGLQLNDEISDKVPSIAYSIKLIANKTYVIDMIAAREARLDPFLRLHDSAGKQLAEDDDSGGGLNARIVFRALTTDTYRITATRLTGTGRFILQVNEKQ